MYKTQVRYLKAKAVADQSGHTPGMDLWWSTLKAEEARLAQVEEEDLPAQDPEEEPVRTVGWAAYTRDGFAPRRWSKAHAFWEHDKIPLCGAKDPGPAVEWAHEDDTRTSGRCKFCERIAKRSV